MTDETEDARWWNGSTRREVLQKAAAASAAVGAGGLLAACGGGDSGASETTGTGAGASSGSLRRGGTLRIAMPAGDNKETLDAHTPTFDVPIAACFGNVYESVALPQPDGELANVLAESIEPKSAQEWVIRLVPDVEFHNGKTVGADDLIFTIRRILDPNLEGSRGRGALAAVDPKQLKKLDERTVQIKLTAPSSAFPALIGQYFNGVVPVGYDPKTPVGTGPFKAVGIKAGERATFERFANYRDADRPQVDRLELIEFADISARVNALLSGQVDGVTNVPSAQVKTIESTSGLKLLNAKSGGYLPFVMQMQMKPFDDVRVRQALRLIIDRPAMIQQALSGYGQLGNDLFARYDPAYASDIAQRVQDIEQAKSLLRQAGQSDLRVELTTAPYYPGMVESAQVLAEQAKAAGVTIKVTKLDIDGWIAGLTRWPFSQGQWYARDYLPQVAQTLLPDAPFPETGWKDAEWTRIVLDAQRELDEDKRNELLHEAQMIDHERGTYAIWGFGNILDAYSDKLGGVIPGVSTNFGNYSFSRMGFLA